MSFFNIMLCYYLSLEEILQSIAKNNPIEKQINVEIQATLKHMTAVKLTEEKNSSLQIARIDFNYKSQLLVSEYVFFRIIFTA